MSRIGKKLITLPQGVKVSCSNQLIKVDGPKGSLERAVHSSMNVVVENDVVRVVPKDSSDPSHKKFHGLVRSLVNNMIVGVSQEFHKSLTLIGVGYRAALKGQELHLTLGFSHPVVYVIPKGISIKVEKQTEVIVSGVDKELVGQTAANIRAYRKPEPYHGKGVRYKDERIVTKVGKAAGKK